MLQLMLAALLTTYTATNPPMSRHDVAIAGDAHHALVAWTQLENGVTRIHVSPLGAGRDVVMPATGELQISPAIAFDGVNYLVVWQAIEFGRPSGFAARVSGSGELLDTTPIALGAYANGFLPRVAWTAGTYHATAGTRVLSINTAGVRDIVRMPPAIDSALDVVLPDDTTVFAQFIPAFCSGFSIPFFHCTPAQNLLISEPGTTISLSTKPLWLEGSEHTIVWSDGTALYARHDGVTDSLPMKSFNAAVAGSLLVYERDDRIYGYDLNTKKESALTDAGTTTPALLDRGNGRYTLLYRTTTRPAQLKTLEIGAPEAPTRRRTF